MKPDDVIKAQINAIDNAAVWLQEMDCWSDLPQEEVAIHNQLGKVMKDNSFKITMYLRKLSKQST